MCLREDVLVLWQQDIGAVCQFQYNCQLSWGAAVSYLCYLSVSNVESLVSRMSRISYCNLRVMCTIQIALNIQSQLNVQTKAVEPLVEGGAQIQQVLNIECLTDFCDAPLLNIKFR